ncbi:MAG: hypothetical protein ABI759_16315 [Candidatus Solibacter sp.]
MLQRHRREVSLLAAIGLLALVLAIAAPGFFTFANLPELPEIPGMSDRMAVRQRGKIASVLTRAEATQERLLALAQGHN